MPFTNDPICNPIDRIRLVIGDVDVEDECLTDDIYLYVLRKNEGNEQKAALECLLYLISKYASYVTEKAGGMFIKESEKFTQFSTLYKMLKNDPTSELFGTLRGYVGGISKSDIYNNEANLDNNLNTPFTVLR